MWLEDINEFSELFKGCFPYYLLVVLPIFIAISPINPVGASHELPVYRMQQYDLHGLPHGKRLILHSLTIIINIHRDKIHFYK